MAFLLQFIGDLRSLAGLPNDCMVDRHSGNAVPHNRRLALIRYTYCRNLLRTNSSSDQGIRYDRLDTDPNFIRVMFHPTRFRIILHQFSLRRGDDCAFLIPDDCTCAGCSLIYRHDVFFFHLKSSFLP